MRYASFFLLLSFFACKKEDNFGPGFDLIYRQEFTIQPGLGVFAVHHFQIENIPTSYQTLLTQHGRTDADIESILAAQIVASGTFGDADFSVVEEATFRMYPTGDPDNWLEVAYRNPVPIEASNILGFIPNNTDLKKFLSEDRFNVDVTFRLRRTTPTDIPVRLDMTFKAIYK